MDTMVMALTVMSIVLTYFMPPLLNSLFFLHQCANSIKSKGLENHEFPDD